MRRAEMHTPRVLFDASNLHVGGGVQVASSLVNLLLEMARQPDKLSAHQWLNDMTYEISPAVAANLSPEDSRRVRVVGRRPFQTLAASIVDKLTGRTRGRELQVVVFGPHWGLRRAASVLLGYADVTAIYDQPARRATLTRALRAWGSRLSVRKADVVVVESTSFGQAVEAVTGRTTTTVPNTYHQAMDDREIDEEPLPPWPPLAPNESRLCYVTRAYPHKNLALLPRVAAEAARLGRVVTFVLTLRQDEWDALEPETRAVSLNVGPLRIGQVPSVYKRSDGAFFPSLLEASSASPIEAMRLGAPLFASDRDFVREVCGEAPFYFPPDQPRVAARILVAALADPELVGRHVAAGRAIAANMPGPEVRAERLAEVISTTLGRTA